MSINFGHHLSSPRSLTLPVSTPCAGIISRRQGGGLSLLILLATFCSLLLSAIPQPAAAGTLITNVATLFSRNKNLASARNDAILVTRTPSTIELLRYSRSGTPYDLSQPEYSTDASTNGPFTSATIPAAYVGGPTLNLAQPLPLAASPFFHTADTIFIRLADADQNLYADQIDSVLVTVNLSTGDKEVLRLFETGNNTGIFVGFIASTSLLTTAPTPGDGLITVDLETTIITSYIDIADQSDTNATARLFDPLGTVFDSTTGLPVNGVTITLIDRATGLPAQVFGDDGSIFQPDPNDPTKSTATVVSGGTATDHGGNLYNFSSGGYRFPLMATGEYQIVLQTPSGWIATLPTTTTFPGGPWTITDGSFGEPFRLDPIPLLRMDIPVDPLSVNLWVEKDTTKSVVAIGDFIPYLIKVTNKSDREIAYNVAVTDLLPRGFRYRKGSTRNDGVPSSNPLISDDGRTLIFTLNQIDPKATKAISYVVEVASGAVQGEAINAAAASTPSGFTSNKAQKAVKVTEDLFRNKSLIVGQILDGCDEDAKGIAGVRIYLEDGTFVITDKDGLYHFEGIRPIAHVVQLDSVTLPPGYSTLACEENTRFAGQNFSQFVEAQGGTLWRADFYAGKLLQSPGDGLPFNILKIGTGTTAAPFSTTGLALSSTISERKVHYRVEFGNDLDTIKNLKLSVKLPAALSLIPGSVKIDAISAVDPNISDDQYIFAVSDLLSGARHVVTFDADIPGGASGEMQAIAILAFDTTARHGQKTPEAANSFVVTRKVNTDYKEFVLTTHFDLGLANLKEVDAKALAEFAQTITDWKIDRVKLVGHTDSLRLTPKTARHFKNNLGLSQARAATIAKASKTLLNLPSEKISSSGKGDRKPIADNRRNAGRAANRRVELKVFLSKERIDSSVEPVLMESGLKEVASNAPLLLMNEGEGLADLTVKSAQSSSPVSGNEKKLGILSPLDASVMPTPISAVRVRIDSRLKPLLSLDGNEIPADRIGFTMVDKETKTTLYSYIGVDFGDAGTHRLQLRGVDPFGNSRFDETETIIRSGAVASLKLIENGKNIADGKTPVRVRIELRDASGQIIPSGVTLAIKGGNLLPPHKDAPIDQSLLKTENQVEADRDGWIEFRPVAQSGAYRTTLVYSEDVEVEIETYITPELRDWILVGIAEGTLGYNSVSGNMESLGDEEIEDAYYDDGRIAFFAKGKIKGDWLMTASYDTAKSKENRLLGTIDPDAYYTLYGDGGNQQYDAPSARKLYVKLEREQFYALFGDYDTGLSVTELARYSRSLNGFKSELKSRYFSYNAFASETRQGFIRNEIAGDGTSGLYRLTRKDLLINSEKIVIETRDRFHSETVLASISLNRHIDYDIDYDGGTLFFKEPIASRDQDFNPIFIVVDYEAMDDRDLALNYGGRAAVQASEMLEVGISHLHEGANGAEGNLTGIDTTIKVGPTKLRAEVATSKVASNIAPTNAGDAYLAELSHQGKNVDGRIYVREQESGFGLGQQRKSESGSRKIGTDVRYRLSETFGVMGELTRQSMLDTGAERDLGQAEITYKEKNYSLRTGLRQSNDLIPTGENNRSTQLLAGGNWQANKWLNLRLSREQSIFKNDDSADFPTRTLLGTDFRISEKITAFIEQEFTRSDDQETDMSRAGLKASPWSGAEMQSTMVQQGSEEGQRVFATTGLKQTWQIDAAWSVDAGLDRSQTLRHPGSAPVNGAAPPASGGAEDFTAISLGANRKSEKWTLSNRIEYRTGDSEDKIGLYSGVEGEIRRGLSLSSRLQFFDSQRSGGIRSFDGNLRLGGAYRPVQSRWILLDRLDYLFDHAESPTTNISNWRLVNNLNANFRPNRQTQISLQYGVKYVHEQIDGQDYKSYTDLPGIEGRYDLSRKWDIGLRGSILHSWSSNQFDYSAGPSVGYQVMKNAWLSFGYNLTGFQDRDFSAADFTAQGPFIKFRFKFDQNSVRDALKQF